MPHEQELDAALDAGHRAGRLILAAYADFAAIPDARADITTEVDRQSQETILQCLRDRFPGDALSPRRRRRPWPRPPPPNPPPAPGEGRGGGACGSSIPSTARGDSRKRTVNSP